MANGTRAHETAELPPRQAKALAAILSTPTLSKAAEASGVGLRTLHTYLADPVFSEAYREARRDAVQHATARLQQMSDHMVSVLVGIAADHNTPAAVRVQAAGKVLDLAMKAVEQDDIISRLDALERNHERSR